MNVVGWIVSPHPQPCPNFYVEVLIPSNAECDHLWDKILTEVIKLKWGKWYGF